MTLHTLVLSLCVYPRLDEPKDFGLNIKHIWVWGSLKTETDGWMDAWKERPKKERPTSKLRELLPFGPDWMFLHSTWGGCQCVVSLLSLVLASFRRPMHLFRRPMQISMYTITVFCLWKIHFNSNDPNYISSFQAIYTWSRFSIGHNSKSVVPNWYKNGLHVVLRQYQGETMLNVNKKGNIHCPLTISNLQSLEY